MMISGLHPLNASSKSDSLSTRFSTKSNPSVLRNSSINSASGRLSSSSNKESGLFMQPALRAVQFRSPSLGQTVFVSSLASLLPQIPRQSDHKHSPLTNFPLTPD